MSFQIAGGQGQHEGGVFGPMPNTSEASSTDFAILVAQKKSEVEGLTNTLAMVEAESSTQQNNQDLKDKVDNLKDELKQAQSELATLQDQEAGQTTGSASATQTQGAGSTTGSSSITTGGTGGTGGTTGAQGANASGPTIPPGDQNAQIQSGDNAGLFLATSMMAILWKVESGLVHQQIENKDAERVCKQYGFEEQRQFGKLEAQAAFNSDMDQAYGMIAQAMTQMFSAVLTIGAALYSTHMAGKAQDEAMQMRDNQEYAALKKDFDKKNPNSPEPLPKFYRKDSNGDPIYDKKGQPIEIKPGRQQIEDAMNTNQKEHDNNTINTGGQNISSQDAYNQRKAALQAKLDNNKVDTQFADARLQNDPTLTFWRQSMPSIIQSSTGAAGSAMQAWYTMDKAKQDYVKTLAQIARGVSQTYMQSAIDAFSSEGQSIQAIIDFMMQASQKNTQWASVRA